jgi:uncharacterized protein
MFRLPLAPAISLAALMAALVAALAAPAAAQEVSPSFDCAKASQPVEHAICADGTLAKLDADLAVIYTEALAQAADAEALRKSQRDWSNERAAACGILPGADDDAPDFTKPQLDCLTELYTARVAELGAAAPTQASAPDPARLLGGMWQVAEIVATEDASLKTADQKGRLIRLDRHGLSALGGAGCAGPTLQPLAEARGRPLDADEQALIAKADAAAADAQDGIAGFCLGRLFALYLPAADGSLLVADAGAVYRLQRLTAPNP